MKSRMKAEMLGLLAMAMMPPEEQQRIMEWEKRQEEEKNKPRVIEQKPPSGTKEYFFNEQGEFSTERMLRTELVFKCYAINDKNAKRKFERWRHGA
jgi:hypothetical protein